MHGVPCRSLSAGTLAQCLPNVSPQRTSPRPTVKKDPRPSTLAGEQELRSPAEAKAAAVRTLLAKQGKMDSARAFLQSGDLYEAPEKEEEAGSRAELEIAAD